MSFLFGIFLISIINLASSRRHDSSSEESIENLLYYKNCQHPKNEKTTTSAEPLKLRAADTQPEPRREPDCPFPRMCCSMTCGNECSQPYNSIPIEPQHSMPNTRQNKPFQPQINPMRKKKITPIDMLPPIGGRRSNTFTKDKIKSLISQDDDIRKILKDLVRVTMQKVDLVEMINKNRNVIRENNDDDIENDYV